MLSIVPLAVLLTIGPSPTVADVAGDYAPDFSQAPASSSLLKTYFQGDLYLDSEGGFLFPSTQQSGYWRIEAGYVVLVYDHFFNAWYPRTKEQAAHVVPDSPMDGHSLEIQSDGTLLLRSLGDSKGPVIFRRQPHRETRDLVKQSQGETGDSTLAFSILWNEQPQRWREILAMALDPKEKSSNRGWALLMIDKKAGPAAGQGLLDALRHLDTTGMNAKEVSGMRARFVREIAKFEDVNLVKCLLADSLRKDLPIAPLADAIASAKYSDALPYLETWSKDAKPGNRRAACEAMVKLGRKAALPYIRPFASDSEASVQVSANEGILRFSNDPVEKKYAMEALVTALKNHEEFTNIDAINAIGASGSKLALPLLINILQHDSDGFARRTAAEQLGDLGFPEAIPVLREVYDDRKPFKGPSVAWMASQANEMAKPGYDKYLSVTVVNALQKLEKDSKASARAKSGNHG